MKKIYFILSFVLFCSASYGQQQNQYTQFALNKYVFNPAYAGLDFSVSANLMYRNQWDGLDGRPTDLNLNVHLPFYLWSGAIGASVDRQSFGVLSQTSLSGSYNYVASLQYGLLSFGGRLGISQLSIDGSRIVTPEGEYSGSFTHNDPILLENTDLGIGIKWDAGVYFYNKKVETGVAISHLPQNSISLERTSYTQATHLNAFFQYNFKILENIDLLQSILLKSDFNQIQSDVSSIIKINGNIFGGINVRGYNSRSLDAMAIIAGMKLGDHYTLSYSYDIGVSGLRRAHEGTHEILLNYNLRKILGSGELPKIIYNPRYL